VDDYTNMPTNEQQHNAAITSLNSGGMQSWTSLKKMQLSPVGLGERLGNQDMVH